MKKCKICGQDIPEKRLQAVPYTELCAPCLTNLGDIAKVRRLDDYFGREAEDCHQTYFFTNHTLDNYIRRMFSRTYRSNDDVDEDCPPAVRRQPYVETCESW